MRTSADPTDDIDCFAALSALLADPVADRAAVLREAGLDAERWRAVAAGWAPRFADGGAVAKRFAEVYDRTRRALATPAAVPVAPASAASGEEVARVGMDAAGPPSTLRSAPPPAAASLAATTDVDLRTLLPAVPFQPRSSLPNPLGDTLEAGTRLPVPVLPFTKPPPLPAPSSPAATAPDVPTFLQPTRLGLAGTELALALPLPRDPLPFVGPSELVGPPRLAEVPPSSEPRPPSPFTGTVDAQALPVPGRVTPFAASAQVSREPVPTAGSTDPVLEGLTLQQYAELCADLAARPADAERIFAARGLADANKRRGVNDAWLTYLGTDANAYARWQDIYRRHASGAR
jgi:hypothetical protein